mgnify:CR=1 FL=1
MNKYEENKGVVIPVAILREEFTPKLSDSELVIILKLLSYGTQKIEIIN